MTVNQCFFKKKHSGKPHNIMKFFCEAKILNASDIADIIEKIKPGTLEREKQDKVARADYSKRQKRFGLKFKYNPLDLPLPHSEVYFPLTIERLGHNCQAINKLLNLTFTESYLDDGDENHKWGLWLDNFCVYDDIRLDNCDPEKADYPLPRRFADNVYDNFRTKDERKHNWHTYKESFKHNPQFLIPKCEVWDKVFGMCKGCKFKGDLGFFSPVQFVTGTVIQKRFLKKLVITSNEYIRDIEFPKVRKLIMDHVTSHRARARQFQKRVGIVGSKKDYVLAYSQGSGKSQFTDSILSSSGLSGLGVRSLLCVPDSKIALQHFENLKKSKVKTKVLFSHEKLFSDEIRDALGTKFMCPFFEEIQKQLKLGLPSHLPKKRFCKTCLHREDCSYPSQYQDLSTDDSSVVIMQHAHMQTREAMIKILAQPFEFVVIDESFIQSCIYNLRVKDPELKVLYHLTKDFKWLKPIHKWLRDGGYPTRRILTYPQEDLQEVLETYGRLEMPWNFPDIMRAYADKALYRKVEGIQAFHPIPRSKALVRMLTDATATPDFLRVILNSPDLEILGSDLILNPKLYHPENEYFQVLDAKTSRRQMEEPGYLDTVLRFQGHLMQTEYQERTALFTVYKSQIPQTEKFLYDNYPDIMPRVKVMQMQKGTNEHSDREVQFINCSRYPNGFDYAMESYNLAQIHNYWVESAGQCLGDTTKVRLVPPYDLPKTSGHETEYEGLTRNELIGGEAYAVEYSNQWISSPANSLYKIVRNKFRAIKTQANRIRYKKGEFRHIWDMDQEPCGHLVTRTFNISEIKNLD